MLRILLVLVCLPAISFAQGRFRPAVFSGLVMGKATIRDMQKKFGTPKDTFVDGDGTTWVYYDDIGPNPGRVEVIAKTKSGIIESINVETKGLTIADVKTQLGNQPREARFSFDDCLGDGESAPLFESKDGELSFLVYDQLGIAIQTLGEQLFIEYLSEPLGPKESKCKGKARKLTR